MYLFSVVILFMNIETIKQRHLNNYIYHFYLFYQNYNMNIILMSFAKKLTAFK